MESEHQHGVLDGTEALARRVQQGDPAGFDSLYRRLAPAIYAWASMRVPPRPE